jgi:hypothetical protein
MESFGKMMVVAGLLLVGLGLIFWLLGPKMSGGTLLPGDISVRRGNFSFYFPIVTCVVVSLLLTLLMRLFGK